MCKPISLLVKTAVVCGAMVAFTGAAFAAPARKAVTPAKSASEQGSVVADSAKPEPYLQRDEKGEDYVSFDHEVYGSAAANMGYNFSSRAAEDHHFVMSLTGGYRYMILGPRLQLGGESTLAIDRAGDNGMADFRVLVGPTVNFGHRDLRNAFFANAGLGVAVGAIIINDNSDSYGLFAWKIAGGKRFKITESVSYAPNMALGGTAGDGTTVELMLNALSFSFFM